jgi:hypothetical protein
MANQTDDFSPIDINPSLPFTVKVEVENFQIPGGIQSGAKAQCGSYFLFLAGRTNGLHGFDNNDDNFPIQEQNTNVIVINVCTKAVYVRSLHDSRAGLTQKQIDTLSVTSPQSYQSGDTLYITGGYGVDTSTGNFSTKNTLTAINVPGLINWTIHPKCSLVASQYIRQISNSIFQVTGGEMFQVGQCPTLLIFGQNFSGFYNTDSNGIYTRQVRRFHIIDDGKCLDVKILPTTSPNPNYRRRDLNVIPIIKTCKSGEKIPAFVALSGVFTLDTGIWTVPVEISSNGTASMANPNLANTFKQGANNYNSAHVELLGCNGTMYSVVFGGLTYALLQNGQIVTDDGIPFTNQISVIERSRNGNYSQSILPEEYPVILSTQSNPGNRLLFGAGAKFITTPNTPTFSNGVLDLSKIKQSTVIGYIVGGIQSTLPNTNTITDSAASPYIFKVTLFPAH